MSRGCISSFAGLQRCPRAAPSGVCRCWASPRMRRCRCLGYPPERDLVGPGLDATEREIVGIGDLTLPGILRLDHLIGNALALAIGHRLFLGIEMQRELLLHVTG